MNKREYMLLAFKNNAHLYKGWVYNIFSESEIPENDKFDYRLYKGNKHYYFIDPKTRKEIEIEDTEVSKQPVKFREKISLKKGEIPNLTKDIETNYGILLANYIMLIYPFFDKIDYVNKEFVISEIENQISARLTTNPEHQVKGEFIPDNPIFVHEYFTFIDAALSLEGYSSICVPGASEKTMVVNPETIKLRDRLFEENKDKLHDQIVVVNIEKQLVESEKKWLKGDISEGFFFSGSQIAGKRKKLLMSIGYEGGFGTSGLIKNSLAEGWNIKDIPLIVSNTRSGAYDRGKETSLGGYATKVINRVFQNVKLSREDCGTKLGWDAFVTDVNKKSLLGFYRLLPDGTSELIDDDNINKFLGKTIIIRTPQLCKSPGTSFCQYCVGKFNSEGDNLISTYASGLTSQIMLISMASIHGTTLSSEKIDIDKCFF